MDCQIEEENLELISLIDEDFLRHYFYEIRKMKIILAAELFPFKHKTDSTLDVLLDL